MNYTIGNKVKGMISVCTSLTLQTQSQHQLLARTMDFPTTSPWQPIYLPAGETLRTRFQSNYSAKFAILGSGRLIDGYRLMGDGFNTAGLAVAELYFPNRTVYHKVPVPGKLNLTPQDIILWLLGNYRSVAEVQTALPQIALIGDVWFRENKVYPFHWIITDQTGATMVLEPTSLTLSLKPDATQVLTNTPELENHIARLNRFLKLDQPDFNEVTIQKSRAYIASGQALPTGPVPTNRFISAAINRWGHDLPATDSNAVATLFNTLDQVVIPRDPEKVKRSNHNYTHYESILSLTDQTYYYKAMTNNRLQTISLPDLVETYPKKPFIFPND